MNTRGFHAHLFFSTPCICSQLQVGTGAAMGTRFELTLRSFASIPPVTGVICVRVVRAIQSLCALAQIRCDVASLLAHLISAH